MTGTASHFKRNGETMMAMAIKRYLGRLLFMKIPAKLKCHERNLLTIP